MGFFFELVQPAQAEAAYSWHRGFAANDHCIFPRRHSAYLKLIEEGCVWCGRDDEGDVVALAYCTLDNDAWEFGGLMVAHTQRGGGVGATIARVALAHMLFSEDPLDCGFRVIAHVHEKNSNPLRLLQGALKFRFVRRISVDAEVLPGLLQEGGKVHGSEFEITHPDSLRALSNWCANFTGILKDGSPAHIEFPPGINLEDWGDALLDMAERPGVGHLATAVLLSPRA